MQVGFNIPPAVSVGSQHQRFVVSLLNQLAVFQKCNLIGIANRGESMGNQEDDSIGSPGSQILQHLMFGSRVERGGRFVQDQNWRIT